MAYLIYSRAQDGSRKPLHFIASSRKDIQDLPDSVRGTFGTLLRDVQYGETPRAAVALSGFGGARVLELAEDYQTNTFRAVYTVQFAKAVYVLHVFQKKSKRGISTPRRDVELIRRRYAAASEHYHQHYTY